jgi:hypothetical protein
MGVWGAHMNDTVIYWLLTLHCLKVGFDLVKHDAGGYPLIWTRSTDPYR